MLYISNKKIVDLISKTGVGDRQQKPESPGGNRRDGSMKDKNYCAKIKPIFTYQHYFKKNILRVNAQPNRTVICFSFFEGVAYATSAIPTLSETKLLKRVTS